MVKYELDHLIQDQSQIVFGPIQDDEALFLYSIIRGCRLSRILEIGGLSGYSAKNFLQALKYNENSDNILYTCDLNHVPVLAKNHKVIIKNALLLTEEDLDNKPIELLFFDCHDMVQMDIYNSFLKSGIINDDTIIALHDTNLHYSPHINLDICAYTYVKEEDGYCHQPVERDMVNIFKSLGYDIFAISTNKSKHDADFPLRHGVTICRKFKTLFK